MIDFCLMRRATSDMVTHHSEAGTAQKWAATVLGVGLAEDERFPVRERPWRDRFQELHTRWPEVCACLRELLCPHRSR